MPDPHSQGDVDRRRFLKLSAATAAAAGVAASLDHAAPIASAAPGAPNAAVVVDDFDRPDTLYHGDGWESLNPGYWSIVGKAMRRRLVNIGDRARNTGFPYHYETHQKGGHGEMPRDYDPSLPHGSIYRRDWRLTGNYSITAAFTVRSDVPARREGDDPKWAMYQPGYGEMGLAIGARSQFDSYGKINQAWRVVYSDDGRFGVYPAGGKKSGLKPEVADAPKLAPGDKATITIDVTGGNAQNADLAATLTVGEGATAKTVRVELKNVKRAQATDGWFGLTAQGLLDFECNTLTLDPGANMRLNVALNECHNCYALGHTLRQNRDGRWTVQFVSMFRNDGRRAEVRIADAPTPNGGWASVPVAGAGDIINNEFRRNTALIDAVLPASPAEKTLYYTVWKDGVDVTADPRLGTDAVGPGTGNVGDVPADGAYVGRLPQLRAPYKLCGLSCHAINANVADPSGQGRPSGNDGSFYVRDQPTYEAYKHLDAYDFQVMLWEDDVWYMELVIYPPSTDDAYKIVNTSISGPTSRWQCMRHWNIVNPGDHDHGMDDVKGPEQLVIRNRGDLGQDPAYMVRNFQIVSHLSRGRVNPSGKDNPKRWCAWKMPDRDFTLAVCDSRLWRTSQDTAIWDDEGWGFDKTIYSRKDPTRALLGEEQHAWLTQLIRTDSSPLICLTGVNGMHTIWTGGGKYSNTTDQFAERDRVAADYAGWVSAGADRIIELLGSRDGVVSVYGDVHNGSIMRNTKHRLYECSFGPIGRSGGRGVIDGFGPRMKDVDGRELDMIALYHAQYGSPTLEKRTGPFYWNFLEMAFDPRGDDPKIGLRVRNMVDPPTLEPRGGGKVDDTAANTGRPITCRLPKVTTLKGADVLITTMDGAPIRGGRTDAAGVLGVAGLVDVEPGTRVIVTAFVGEAAHAEVVTTTKPA
ncbi:MAG: twin-arginine translocation signal domain-containing protein [Phycisphaera sp.]|nr:twin-arginine translocation signal domain-containing protein [Phycisphaera sp.]